MYINTMDSGLAATKTGRKTDAYYHFPNLQQDSQKDLYPG